MVSREFRSQQPVAQVGDEYEFVVCPVFVDLRRCCGVVKRFGGCFDFDDAARGAKRVLQRVGFAVELVGYEQAAVRVARALMVKLYDAANLRLEPAPTASSGC